MACYTVPYTGTLTAAGGNTDLFALKPATQKPIKLRGLIFSQSTELGDAAEENLRITIQRFPATVTDGTGGAAVTPVTMSSLDAAAGFTARCNDTAVATTSGTAVTHEEFGWNVRVVPLERYWWDDRFAYTFRNAEACIIRCESTALDDITIMITAICEEV